LWGLEPTACEHVIEVLVRSEFLRRVPDGMITRVEA
jgi:hypothetical protein